MAVNRVWYPNVPSGTIDTAQGYQLLIGYSLNVINPIVTYFRRYLNDVTSVTQPGAAVVVSPTSDTNYSNYLRRYLNDPT